MTMRAIDNSGDPFSDPLMRIVMIALLLLVIVGVFATAAIYYGDDVAVPSWNEHAVPAPETTRG